MCNKTSVKKFKIHVTDTHITTVHIDINRPIDDLGTLPSEYDGFGHNFDGVKGFAVERAVKKLFGKDAYWYGSYDNYNSGQVFRPSRNKDQHVSTSLTNIEYLDIEELN